MEAFTAWGEQALRALAQLLLNPLYYLGILFVLLQYRRQISLERKLFHTRLHSLLGETWRTVLWGWLGGITASLLMLAFGVSFTIGSMLLIWAVAIFLLLVRVRYLCLAYSAGIVGILYFVTDIFPQTREWQVAGWIFDTAAGIDMTSLLMLVAILHLVEGLLMRWQGMRLATPMFLKSKRGKLVGAYYVQGIWTVPLFLLIPVSSGGLQLSWSPLFVGDGVGTGWGLIAFPAMIGFTSFTLSQLPSVKNRFTSGLLFGYAGIMIAASVASYFWNPFVLAASLIGILFHEAIIILSNRKEEENQPLYVSDSQGLKILAVLPGSPAAEMGIQAGEIIKRVNQVQVRTKEEFHQAMQINSAFCKLEIINLEGHSKFINKAVFADHHHQLGILLCPDAGAPYFVAHKPGSFLTFFRRKPVRLYSNKPAPEQKT